VRVAERVAVRPRAVEALPRELPRSLLPAAGARAVGPRHGEGDKGAEWKGGAGVDKRAGTVVDVVRVAGRGIGLWESSTLGHRRRGGSGEGRSWAMSSLSDDKERNWAETRKFGLRVEDGPLSGPPCTWA
jgi:hypothetical protein